MPSTNRYLMCQPVHFDVCYVINPWMEGNLHSISADNSMRQWESLYDTVTLCAAVDLIPAEPGLPDMIFTANAGLVVEKKVVLSRFLHPERQGEERFFGDWFEAHGYDVYHVPSDIPFEGAGDALIDHENGLLWAGYGFRSRLDSHALLSRWLDLEVISLHLRDRRFYHLDTCFCPLSDGYLLYYPAAFDEESLRSISQHYPKGKQIAVTDEEAASFACNAVNSDDLIIVNRASERLEQQLTSAGFRVAQVGLSEFIKSGGTAKCLTLKLTEPHPALQRCGSTAAFSYLENDRV
jgi:N-dimethylarginine dimethylaminohydrolase